MRGRGRRVVGDSRGGGPGLRRLGFTMVEVLIVSAVVGIVTRIAIPNVNQVLLKARAAEVAGDLRAVETAALDYWAENFRWPEDTDAGTVPEELVPHLPEGFSFEKERYVLDWENWSLRDGLPNRPGTTTVVGIAVVPDEALLGRALLTVLGETRWFAVGDTYTWLVES